MTRVKCLKNDDWDLLGANINAWIEMEKKKGIKEFNVLDIKSSVVTNIGVDQNFFYIAMIIYVE